MNSKLFMESNSQLQGLVKRANQDIEKMLSTWFETSNMTKWWQEIKLIQFRKNWAHHSSIDCSPYEAMLGHKPKIGLRSYLPNGTLTGITGEDFVELRNQFNNDAQNQIAVSTKDNSIGAMNDDLLEGELGDSSEDLEVITVAASVKIQ